LASPNPTPTVSSLLPSPRTFIYPQPPPDMVGVELGGGGAARVLPSPTASPRDRPCSPRWVPDKANPDEQLLRAHAQAQAIAYVRRHSLVHTHARTHTHTHTTDRTQHDTRHTTRDTTHNTDEAAAGGAVAQGGGRRKE
jgi:hypothetical protein